MDSRVIIEGKELSICYPDGFKTPKHIETHTFHKQDEQSTMSNTEIFFEGVKISSSYNVSPRNTHVYTEQNYPAISMLFMISGISRVYPVDTSLDVQHLNLPSAHHNVGYAPTFASWFEVESHRQPFRFVDIQLTREYFEKLTHYGNGHFSCLMDAVYSNRHAYLSERHLPFTARMHTLLEQMMQCQHTGYMKKVLMESRVIELLNIQGEQYQQSQHMHTGNSSLKKYDIEKLYAAREYLASNPLMPPSVLELARLVGLNDFKLKKGFRELFHTTVFGYANDLRMNLAKRMLLDEQKTIADVADALGYSQPHHFSAAFKKKFGVSPGRLKPE